jgi:hypothetical protein
VRYWDACTQALNLNRDLLTLLCFAIRVGVGQQVMELGELDGADPILRFHSVDILLKLVEHGLDRPEDETPILRIML